MDRTGCKYCKGNVIPASSNVWNRDYDPYYYDRSYYPGYGYYGGYYGGHHRYSDFTDADSSSVAQAQDTDFEQDLGGS
jgi:hypothetical protein